MSNQTTINGSAAVDCDHSDRGSARAVMGNAAGVVHDITHLLELQTQLLLADAKAMSRRTAIAAVALVVSACLILATLPVALIGLAEVVVLQTELTHWQSYLAVAGSGLLLALVLLSIGYWGLRNGLNEFDNSRQELKRNVAWLKHTLKQGGSSPLHQHPR